MSKFTKVYYQLYNIEDEANSNAFMNNLHPLIKLITTIVFIFVVISINKYNLTSLLYLTIYPISLIMLSNASFKAGTKLFVFILPFLLIAGVFNVFLDTIPMCYISNFCITSGMISFFTLLIKGFYTFMTTYFFIVTTGIDKMTYSLKLLHIPNILVNQILLTYRYLFVLIKEANDMNQAYSLRTPKNKGIHFSTWGSFLGVLFLRTSKRADNLYESMKLKGFNDKLYCFKTINYRIIDIVYIIFWIIILFLIKFLR